MTTEIKAIFPDPCLYNLHCSLLIEHQGGFFIMAHFCGDFKRDFAAISNRPCKLLAIPQRFESPVVYTGNRFEIAAKIASIIPPPSARISDESLKIFHHNSAFFLVIYISFSFLLSLFSFTLICLSFSQLNYALLIRGPFPYLHCKKKKYNHSSVHFFSFVQCN